MGAQTLLICLGAAKAGTSWLHSYLANHPQCHLRGVKELHYFDAVETGDFEPWIDDVEAQRRAALDTLDQVGDQRFEARAQVAQDATEWLGVLRQRRRDDAAYMAYLGEGRGGARLVADFTPAYGLLPEAALDRMANICGDVRFIYLLRDPVERLWSHIRMIAGRRTADLGEVRERAGIILRKLLNGREREIAKRSDYAGPLTRMRNALNPVQMHVAFYEELFCAETLARISGFLGLDVARADFARRVMAGPDAAMKPRQWLKMREFLAPQYDAMGQMFEQLPETWGRQAMKV